MQARRNNSASDGGWEELSAPDEVRSVSSCFTDEEEIVIFASPRSDLLRKEEQQVSVSSSSSSSSSPIPPQMMTIEVAKSPSRTNESQPAPAGTSEAFSTSAVVSRAFEAFKASAIATGKPAARTEPLLVKEVDTSLSPIEKTLLHQITRLSEELEVSKQENEILQQTIHRDDMGMFPEADHTMFLRLGLKTLGFFVLLSVVQRKFLISGLVSIFGAAVVGGLLTYEQEATKRRRGE
jgi:hypothetical protein